MSHVFSRCFFGAGFETNPTLQQCFKNFCVYGKNHGISQGGPARSIHQLRMNNFQFIHLCKDAGFAEPEGRLHREALDVIFFRAAAIGQRHISFRVSLCTCLMLSKRQITDMVGRLRTAMHGVLSSCSSLGCLVNDWSDAVLCMTGQLQICA